MAYRQYSFTGEQRKTYEIEAHYGLHPTETFLLKDSERLPVIVSRNSDEIEESLDRRIRLIIDNTSEGKRTRPIRELIRQQEKEGKWFLPAEGIYLSYIEDNNLKMIQIRNVKETETKQRV
jgi:hypothetical protein